MIISLPSGPFGRLPAFATIAAMLLTSGCVGPKIFTPEPPPIPDGGAPVPADNEAVLEEGTQVVAKTGFGRIKIEAGPGMRRVFSWNGLRRGVVLKPDDDEASDGDNGLYFTGKPPVWEPANGVTKVKIREGHHDFANADDALIWMQIRRPYFTYNNEGLAVGWRRSGDTLEAEIWQFRIDGAMPSSIPKADDQSIRVGPLVAEPQKMQPLRIYADGHTAPATAADLAAAEKAEQQTFFERLFNPTSRNSSDENVATASKPRQNTAADGKDAAAGNVESAQANDSDNPGSTDNAGPDKSGIDNDKVDEDSASSTSDQEQHADAETDKASAQ